VREGHLVASNSAGRAAPLIPSGPDKFEIRGGDVSFHRNPAGQIDSLRYSTGRAMNLLFVHEPGN
jgi:hypothetical protein